MARSALKIYCVLMTHWRAFRKIRCIKIEKDDPHERENRDEKSTGRKAGLIGIRGKLIGCTLVPLFLLLTVVAFFLGWQVQSRLNKIQEQNIQQQIDAAATAVEAYFEPAFTTANVVAEMSSGRTLWMMCSLTAPTTM